MTLAVELKSVLLSNGASLVGYADLSDMEPAARYGLSTGISIAVALNPNIIAGIEDGPTKDYLEECSRANTLLNSLGQTASVFLRNNGLIAKKLLVSIDGAYPEALSMPLPHKTVATKAGLGWIGKCALLITEQYGSALRLITVLTDSALPASDPVTSSRCGECANCVESCPASAASGQNWHVNLHRDAFFDAHSCRETARRIAEQKIGVIKHTICGKCIVACPFTQKYIKASK